MRLSGQFQFFLRSTKQMTVILLEVFLHKKLLPLLFLFACFCFVGWFWLVSVFFYAQDFVVEEKKTGLKLF